MKNWADIQEGNHSKTTYIPTYSKICPMISNTDQAAECVHDSCSWYDSKYGRCAVFSIACKK